MAGGVGHTGGLTNPAPGAEDAEPVFLIPVGLPCLERGRHIKKYMKFQQSQLCTVFMDLCVLPVDYPSMTVVPYR